MAKNADTRSRFKTRWRDRRPRYWLRKDPERRSGFRDQPEVVRFEVEPGSAPSEKPPVRIFLGTEPMQARAERVFIWSVKRRRDPSRVYEIHLMRDLAGFDRTRWTTGFTNYRYAIPAFADAAGRAIYNDVDQIYLADPAEMFDLDMARAGVLCLDPGETSVALIDCAAMAAHWRIDDARVERRRRHFLDPLENLNLWGPLGGDWNARDDEYRAGRSKCLHFTTLRLQPWRPFPEQLRYREHPDAGVWRALESQANAARFTAFSRDRPSSGFAKARRLIGTVTDIGKDHPHFAAAAADFVAAHRATSVLECSSADAVRGSFPFSAPSARRHDGVCCTAVLCRLPEDDVPWALDELFSGSRRFVFVAVDGSAVSEPWAAGTLPWGWWKLQMELAAARTPGRAWRLVARVSGARRPLMFDGQENPAISMTAA